MLEPSVVVDISALQSPESRGRGIGRYALSWALALERHRPDLVSAYTLNPALAPPGNLRDLESSGKVRARTAAIVERATIFHQLAPFDLLQPASTLLPKLRRDQLASATVYDLIPALDLERELIDARDQRRYRTRLELVRSLHGFQVLSQSVARDLSEVLDIRRDRIHFVGAAPDDAFVPPRHRTDAAHAAHARWAELGLHRPYVLYPSGSHPRKNNEYLIRAWSSLAVEVREAHQLVIVGGFDDATAHHLHHLASALGAGDGVVLPGYVTDAEMVGLVQGARLMCFASLAEGFGLPIVEALACETPVIASHIGPHEELLAPHDLFDPHDEAKIASAIEVALTREPSISEAPPSWQAVAERTARCFDEMLSDLASRPMPKPLLRPRPRVAIVSPFPPAPSGIAKYSYRLVEALDATEKVEITCFSDGPTSGQIVPEGLPIHRVEALQHVERLSGPFDEVVYVVGNSHHHLGALAMAAKRRGVVMSHDVRLTNLYRHAHGDPGLELGGLGREIQRMYSGLVPATIGAGGDVFDDEFERYGLLMARDLISLSSQFLVTSDAAAHLATIDARPRDVRRITKLPFAMEAPRSESIEFVESRSARPPCLEDIARDFWGVPPPQDRFTYLGHFGIVDPSKNPELCIDAIAAISHRDDLRLVFVGPIADSLCAQLCQRARDLGIDDRVLFTGPLSARDYIAWLRRARLALQLRTQSNGEASAAVGECLASGVPTMVSDIGWSRELPSDVAIHVPREADAMLLASMISRLLDDEQLCRAFARSGETYASHFSFDYAARKLLSLVADRIRPSRPIAQLS